MTETKTLTAEVKALADSGSLEIYAAAFDNVDRQGEVIEKGAFKNLPSFEADGWIALNHDWDDLPVASIKSAIQDGEGLKVVAEWHTTPEAQACRTVVAERMARGKAVKCSIGYRVMEDEIQERGDKRVRVLKGIEVYEASIVNLPANPRARVTAVKSWSDDIEEAYLALKEGRAISTRNRSRLETMCNRLKEAAADLEAMLAETDAPKGEPDLYPDLINPKSADVLAVEAVFLALCANTPCFEVY
jgi:uncharacterized protein